MISTDDLQLPLKYPGYEAFLCYRGVIPPHRQVLVMGTIVAWGCGRRKGAQRKAAKHQNHKCQLLGRAAFPPGSHHRQLTVLRLGRLERHTRTLQQSLVLQQNQTPCGYTVFQRGITVIRSRFGALTGKVCSPKLCSRLHTTQNTHLARYFFYKKTDRGVLPSCGRGKWAHIYHVVTNVHTIQTQPCLSQYCTGAASSGVERGGQILLTASSQHL